MDIAAVIVAAGRGTRAGGPVAKQWQPLAGRAVAAHALAAFAGHPAVGRVVVAVAPQDRELAAGLLPAGTALVEGGATRTETVRAALEALARDPAPPAAVLIHDGARPLVGPALIGRVCTALAEGSAAAPGLAVTDALWRGAGGRVAAAVEREGLWRAQTPQGFRYEAILAAYRAHPGPAADDVEVARAAGLDVAIVEGEEDNLKITRPQDFARAAAILAARGERAMEVRCGTGFDVHRFGPGERVWLCGVAIPFDRGLEGHSDADVGLHALADAIYGALAEGDIGRHFPPTEPVWKGAASARFLAHAGGLARARGFRIANVDVTLLCERPRIAPHAAAMREAVAAALGIAVGQVSVKATTTERLGFTGREEGIAAMAAATLVAP
ncbi:MAG: bifunctional 2-C-methyl-D-erythritol 4-phosphate cytidylyltransferase/2-C-methyl-D-erythritol 2,4-cyclodiphosphate synthase [Rhodobacteraceae bacterium]|jgi:2-C-methyl-D-erythritol 4-phosphate cytidylyltransferase/2-C-methyl-D-erythritol 2,4-cyclodiphosphate synthase|nr:bifunctional 2-C-methyl-D-erythritol 4-phosphate cytidylyltransferase/2-C-methyl-D-erythritol 2,4-cyclodiphosphate synthase [Paracoccaceae bacterium]